jgi:hypothetical protein
LPCRAADKRALRARARTDFDEHHYATKSKVPEGFAICGVSQYDPETNRWLKTERTAADKAQAVQDAFASITIPAAAPVAPPEHADSDLLAVYPIGDPHFGMFAWGQETGGDDFDLSIASTLLSDTIDRLFVVAPPADEALVLQLGDFFHANDATSRTPRGGHVLDTDTRFAKVLGVGIDACVRIIERALRRHRTVRWRNNRGNHDPEATAALTLALAHHYHNEPRVVIEPCIPDHWYFEFGACLLGTTHGQHKRGAALAEIMACDVAPAWGRTLFRRWYVGHVHHESVVAARGCVIETFNTTAPADQHAASAGYRAGRDLRCHVWHRDRGLLAVRIESVG